MLEKASIGTKDCTGVTVDNPTDSLASKAHPSTGLRTSTEFSLENVSLTMTSVSNHITREFIFKKLCALNIGYIHKLTEVQCKYRQGFKRIFIRLRWNNEPRTIDIRQRLLSGDTIKLVYEMPWFWELSLSS
jgi:hypothetical protein